ncbi:DUF7344 domain-containing protein [Salinigranum halophilum]|uniref:DUF7344 domain-containing protein n=1 Tax=Salinigranum halophilum TaxID=2565931 RepID=UPI0010A7A58B|nr:hypothetical protein [Salinigranum halophilum]
MSTDFEIDPAVLELNHVFSALGHSRRRYLMYALVENPQWTLTELATKLAAWEDDCHEDDVEPHRRDEMYISLYHSHIPKLVDEGVVEYDPDEETIAQSTHAEQVLNALAGAGGSLDLVQEQHAERSYGETEDGS